MYNHIIWDFDGTLFDTYPMLVDSLRRALIEMKINDEYDNIMSLMRISHGHTFEHYKNKYNVDLDILKQKYDGFRSEVNLSDVKPFPSADKIIKDVFKADKKNYIYTNRGKSVIDYLEHHNLIKYFEDIVSKEDKFERKPSPEALLYLLTKHNINKEEAIMIGDRDIDVLAGKNAGIKSCYFDIFSDDQVKVADYVVNSIDELYKVFGLEK
ncbi:HAD-IA family hydrolase [Clostridiaceae bacterium M8S5]|nr:HAD-IA family hydrolase [Clostridiaceae bacterium M8S5]